MTMLLRAMLCVAALFMAAPALATPTATPDATLERIKAAILAGNADDLARIDDRIAYLPTWDEAPSITPAEALKILHGCTFESATSRAAIRAWGARARAAPTRRSESRPGHPPGPRTRRLSESRRRGRHA